MLLSLSIRSDDYARIPVHIYYCKYIDKPHPYTLSLYIILDIYANITSLRSFLYIYPEQIDNSVL